MKLSLDAILTFSILFGVVFIAARAEVRWQIYQDRHALLIHEIEERHEATLRAIDDNRREIEIRAADRFTRSDAIRYHLIPATQP